MDNMSEKVSGTLLGVGVVGFLGGMGTMLYNRNEFLKSNPGLSAPGALAPGNYADFGKSINDWGNPEWGWIGMGAAIASLVLIGLGLLTMRGHGGHGHHHH